MASDRPKSSERADPPHRLRAGATLQALERGLGFPDERMTLVGGDVLVTLERAGAVAGLLIRLREFVERIRAALGARAIRVEAGDGEIGPGEIVKVHVSQKPAALEPCLLVGRRCKALGLVLIDLFEQGPRPIDVALPLQY